LAWSFLLIRYRHGPIYLDVSYSSRQRRPAPASHYENGVMRVTSLVGSRPMRGRLAALMLATVAVAAAPVSYADPGDASFVQQLSSQGIHISDPPSTVGDEARMICELLKDHWTIDTVKYSVKSSYPDLSEAQDRSFAILAQKTFCPDA
jgi:hypothetical protein